MKTLKKLDLESMKTELEVLEREEERGVLGGASMEDIVQGLINAGYTGNIDLYGDAESFTDSMYLSGNFTYHSGSNGPDDDSGNTDDFSYMGKGQTDCALQTIANMSGASLREVFEYHVQLLMTELGVSEQVARMLAGTGTSGNSAIALYEQFIGGNCNWSLVNNNYYANNPGAYTGPTTGVAGYYTGLGGTGTKHVVEITGYNRNTGMYTGWDAQNKCSVSFHISQVGYIIHQ